MRSLLAVSAVLAIAGCASSEAARKAAAAPLRWCNPCAQPCTSPCGQPPVAAAPAAAPAPAPKPAPYAPPPAPTMSARFDPTPGTYETAQSVTLSSDTPDAVIHYTTDGSTPTTSSPTYAGPIAVDRTTTIRALAVAPGKPESAVAEGSYTIQPPRRVVVTETRLELREKVYFDTGKAVIKPVSYPLLDDVAKALADHPGVKRVQVEGHTDDVGSASLNTRLSQRRAEAVRAYLIEKGVAKERLVAKGFGPSKPIADNGTAEGREQNRRVEFTILE